MYQKGPVYASEINNDQVLHSVPTNPIQMSQFLDTIKRKVEQSTRTGASNQIGHMSSCLPYFHRPLARLLTALNQNVVKVETASTFTSLEKGTIAMLHQSFYQNTFDFYEKYRYAPDGKLIILTP